jgi:ribose transport system ATP-binding protein
MIRKIGAVWWAVALLYAVSGLISPGMFQFGQILNILQVAAFLGVVATGQTIALLTGGIDLSVAGMVTMANIVSTSVMAGQSGNILPAIIVCLLLGSIVGLANGFIIAIVRVPLALVSIGQMTVILLGGIDLSVGPLISLVTAIASFTIVNGPTGVLGILLCLATGLLVGGLNSALIVWLRIPDLISTLATYSVLLGMALIVRPSPGGSLSEDFADTITMRLGWFPAAGLVLLVIGVIGELLLLKGRIGTRLYAVGSRPEAAFVAGIRVNAIRCCAYLFCGFMAAVAGLVVAARIGSGDPQAGSQFTLSSIAAVVVGGTSVFGGRGTLIGTLLGAILLMLLQNVLNELHVTAYYQYIWTGTLLLLSVALYSLREYRR